MRLAGIRSGSCGSFCRLFHLVGAAEINVLASGSLERNAQIRRDQTARPTCVVEGRPLLRR